MLKEDDVNRFVQSYLLSQGYEISDSHLGTSKGPDILAKKDGAVLEIECKGSCSPTTGQPFNKNQDTYSRVTQAVFNLIKAVELNTDNKKSFALAIPKDGFYLEYLEGMENFFKRNRIRVFVVNSSGEVNVFA